MSQRITYKKGKKNLIKNISEPADHLQEKTLTKKNISEPADHLQKKQGNKKIS